MSDTTSRGDDDVLGGGFDQTNDQVGGLQGESGGTADGEASSAAERQGGDDDGKLFDGPDDPMVTGATHVGNDQPEDGRGI